MNENTKRLEPVPFDTFAEHLGPKHENVKDAEYILGDGTMLTSMPDIPWLYQSADRLVTGEAASRRSMLRCMPVRQTFSRLHLMRSDRWHSSPVLPPKPSRWDYPDSGSGRNPALCWTAAMCC